ncbi:hypothetical protein IQ07DRAFT_270972 [Pyrenochaeta sp. DS3sAY3a]|nr:hypothetical protein IQ07DRAFT_270972 [Pyrenochaeta sp. DS3sAY3a]
MSSSMPGSSISNLREFFSRDSKDKISGELKRALALLHIHDLDGLEERFLSTEAFLAAWSTFRDSLYLLPADAMSRASPVKSDGDSEGITRKEILWFYTHYDAGKMRYDPRGDPKRPEYTTDSSLHGRIDKSNWGIQEYEKHLYVWLLQDFKVGKRRNPFGFDYFELQQVCSAWEYVLVPIINAVRASYNIKGRQHYGRLALFIEDRRPSRVAFPEGNVVVAEAPSASPAPFRVRPSDIGPLTARQYDDTEKELREVYPMYGGLVERPKFKYRMDEWLAAQRARAAWRKENEAESEMKIDNPPPPQLPKTRSHDGTDSPLKRYSDGIRRSFSLSGSKKQIKEVEEVEESPKSPLHGVTRPFAFPDDPSMPSQGSPKSKTKGERSSTSAMRDRQTLSAIEEYYRTAPNTSVQQPLSGHQARRNVSETVRGAVGQTVAQPWPLRDTILLESPTSLRPTATRSGSGSQARQGARLPSYEGTGYGEEISLTNLHIRGPQRAPSPEAAPVADRPRRRAGYADLISLPVHRAGRRQPARSPDGVPASVDGPHHPVGDADEIPLADLRPAALQVTRSPEVVPAIVDSPPRGLLVPPHTFTLAARRAQRERTPPATRPWPGKTPPQPVPWPGSSPSASAEKLVPDIDDVPPPIPPKSPARMMGSKGSQGRRASQFVSGADHTVTRFVSKENIRAQLDRNSEDSFSDDVPPVPPVPAMAGEPGGVRSSGNTPARLKTYNTHMFPRRGDKAPPK